MRYNINSINNICMNSNIWCCNAFLSAMRMMQWWHANNNTIYLGAACIQICARRIYLTMNELETEEEYERFMIRKLQSFVIIYIWCSAREESERFTTRQLSTLILYISDVVLCLPVYLSVISYVWFHSISFVDLLAVHVFDSHWDLILLHRWLE